ncbi:aminodeoxychorismate synthase component I [Chelatococcus sp. SYSU_G07232]|uniref:aminodeoxychorismate synthase n=1 Tax=Chelatococcus albus TaxID=3047466 RepID=A0ABT7AF23_9HYPH|nr:aminodeoxychorismate synthase component I [Chelatococcus sp. SYSU_G07232]MDJ1157970.1 aminodeoxychorismate synthase component I [Chelatococcus sp. SYSU_G07232]
MDIRDLGQLDPMVALRRLAGRPHVVFLDSAMRHEALGRWSFLACDPFAVFSVEGGRPSWNGTALDESPLAALRRLLAKHRAPGNPDLPPFQGGAAGYVGYDLGHRLEPHLPPPTGGGLGCPEAFLGFYDVVIAWDHVAGRCLLLSTGQPERDPAQRHRRAGDRAEEALARLRSPEPARRAARTGALDWRSNFTSVSYRSAVERVIAAILDGDIFQANIAQRFSAMLPGGFDPLAFYERLRHVNPAPFGAFLRLDDVTIASSSPERFLACRDRRVETRPIKGTARRAADPAEDAARAAALMASDKDRAENVMIVDLLRNDLSKVCRPGSIEVPILCGLESYASVHHLVSVVTGTLAEGEDAVSLLGACFPGGSITGAPKIRAMEIIAEIERLPREVYCGAIGYIGFDGSMDTNIAIRTVTMKDGQATFHAGGGVTALSHPQAEYEETLAKAQRLFAAFGAGEPDLP